MMRTSPGCGVSSSRYSATIGTSRAFNSRSPLSSAVIADGQTPSLAASPLLLLLGFSSPRRMSSIVMSRDVAFFWKTEKRNISDFPKIAIDRFQIIRNGGPMEPAATIIRRLGGAAIVAAVVGTAVTAPYRWQYPRARGGTGGVIPQ